MLGATIGNYVVKRVLGQGGMGAVYLAEHALLGRPAAVKVLLPAISADAEIVQRFFDEARVTTAIHDPGIVQIFDFGVDAAGRAYIVMEYLEGETLDQRLEREGPLGTVAALRIVRQVALALHAAHLHGVVHRDLKLENVLLVEDPAVPGGERAKVLDFGIAKLSNDERRSSRTRTGLLLGTPIYMSPEQCRGASDVDGRADVYALGCLLFCLVTGRPPFDHPSNGEIIAAHLKDPAPAPSSRRPGVAPEIDQLVAVCLEKDPARRYQSMAELAADTTEILCRHDRGDGALDSLSGRRGRPTTLSSAARARMPRVTSPTALTLHGRAPRRRAVVGTSSAAILVVLVAAGATWQRHARPAREVSAPPRAPVAEAASAPAHRAPEPPVRIEPVVVPQIVVPVDLEPVPPAHVTLPAPVEPGPASRVDVPAAAPRVIRRTSRTQPASAAPAAAPRRERVDEPAEASAIEPAEAPAIEPDEPLSAPPPDVASPVASGASGVVDLEAIRAREVGRMD